ncbi:hypothetical protein D3C81_2000450 [compost metagenome]
MSSTGMPAFASSWKAMNSSAGCMLSRWTFSVRLAVRATASGTTRHIINVFADSFFFSTNACSFARRRPPAATS